jgi:hypothetical protein
MIAAGVVSLVLFQWAPRLVEQLRRRTPAAGPTFEVDLTDPSAPATTTTHLVAEFRASRHRRGGGQG